LKIAQFRLNSVNAFGAIENRAFGRPRAPSDYFGLSLNLFFNYYLASFKLF
jgi:hypothetical protein